MKHRTLSAFITLAAISTAAHAQLSDFLVATSNGRIHEVDGDTLVATEIVQLQNRQSISEILYVGNDEILASIIGSFVRYNLRTGIETIEFNTADVLPNPAPGNWTESAAFTAQRNVYFGIAAWNQKGNYRYGVLYNPHDGTLEEMAKHIDPPNGLYFDYIEVDNHVFLAAEFSERTARLIDAETGETLSIMNTDEGIVSFLTLDDTVYAITKQRKLFTFDMDDGSMELYGSITGLNGAPIGATSMTVPQTADINYDGSNDVFDIFEFLESFESSDPVADWNDDGEWDFYDVSGFVSDFSAQ